MKRIIILLIAMFSLCLAMAAPVCAAGSILVTDNAGVMTEQETSELNKKAQNIAEKYEFEVVLFIVPDMATDSFDMRAFAESLYTHYEYGYGEGKDGLMLVMTIRERSYSLIAFGYGNVAFTDYGKDIMLDNYILPLLADDKYYEAFSVYMDKAAEYLAMAKAGQPFDVDNDPEALEAQAKSTRAGKMVVTIVVPLLIALIVCLIFRSQMKTARKQKAAQNYIPQGGFVLTGSSDTYLYSTETRVPISDSSSGGGRGGTSVSSSGFSGRSGKF